MRHLIFLATLFCLAGTAAATTYEASIGVTFPDEVAGLPFAGRKAFPQKELGVNLGYQRSGPVRGSIYIYTGGEKNIPPGPDSFVVRNHFAKVISEVKELEKQGKVRAIKLPGGDEQITSSPGCGPQFVWRAFEMDLPEGTLASSTYLTGINGNFVKLRISYPKGDAKGQQDANLFLEKMRQILGNCKD